MEQQIWSERTRLIANSIMFYNAFILSKLLGKREVMKRHEEADLIKRISPIAWRHINLYGQYEFYRESTSINVDEIIDTLDKESIWHQLAESDQYLK